jgi:hypothetical protein
MLTESSFAGSIFSRRGIGLLATRDNVRAIGMGGVGIALGDSISFYFFNPAGMSRVNFTRVQGEFRYERASIDLAGINRGEALLSDANVNSFALAIPLEPGTVLAFGVRPYSNTDFQSGNIDSNRTYVETLSSVGGVSELYLTFAKKFGAWRVGATTDFYFGRINRIWELSYFSSEYQNSEDISNHHFSGIGLHGGVQTQFGPWHVGTAMGMPIELTVKNELHTLSGYNSEITKSSLKLPFWLATGIGLAPNRHWLFSADFRQQRWSFVNPQDLFGDQGVDSYELGLGAEVIPSFDPLAGFFKRMHLRVGGNFQQLPYEEPAGKKVRQWTMNLGLGLPFGGGYNRIDFAVGWGQRGSLSENLVKEDIVFFHASIVGSERWFQRPKRK